MKPYSTKNITKIAVLILALLLVFWIASYFSDVVVLLILSGLLSFILSPFVGALEIRGAKRTVAISLVFLLIFLSLGLGIWFGLPLLMDQLQTINQRFQDFPLAEKLQVLENQITKKIPFIQSADLSKRIDSAIANTMDSILSGLSSAVSIIMILVIVPFVTFFMLKDGARAAKQVIEWVPNKYFEMSLNALRTIRKELVGYLRGWILDSIIVGIMSIIGYLVLGIDYAVLNGIFAGAANLVPYVGPVVGAGPGILISLIQYGDFRMVLPIAIMSIVVQLIDNTFVQPLCFAKTVDMHPLTVILVLLAGNEIMGVMGMVLAIPLATILKVTAVEAYWGLTRYRLASR